MNHRGSRLTMKDGRPNLKIERQSIRWRALARLKAAFLSLILGRSVAA